MQTVLKFEINGSVMSDYPNLVRYYSLEKLQLFERKKMLTGGESKWILFENLVSEISYM